MEKKTPVLDLIASLAKEKDRYWLMKTEPEQYSIDNLKKDGTTPWDGIRNYQARNFMRDHMKKGDQVLIYHSNAKPPGIAGLGKVSAQAKPDATAFDKSSKYYDPKSNPDAPRWVCVDIKFVKKFKEIIPLDALKEHKALKDMLVVQRGQRLSIQPVRKKEFETIVDMA